ncbi:MAG TPA: monofunctional biosynthetic peptidoglycan transglycosylase [Flavobacteriaceae bacterium]|nr:monofunctional biosynthetic peptidoglycan transglycosylase [Flavobacteriaceae bacterium]
MKKFFKFLLKIILWFFAISVFLVLIFKWLPVPFTPLMGIRYFENPDQQFQHDWVPLEEISKNLQLAVIASEDQNFETHNGFDVEAIQKVLEKHKSGKPMRGASTISQQTAKNVFLWPGRSWVRKGLEAYFTALIELVWSKERILEVYLNSIEMGNGIYGAEAASEFWFHKPATNLTSREAAALAAILPNPREYRANPPTSYIQSRINWIVEQMRYYGKFELGD